MTVRHCPNPECPYRAKHGIPAEYRPDVTNCSDCGSELAEGKGCFDAEDIRSSKPLEILCGRSSVTVEDLGKAAGDPVVLQDAPGAISVPVIQLVSGAVIIAVSFYYINQRVFVALIPALVGFVIFYMGFNHLKHRDRRQHQVRLHLRGFSYQIGEKTVAVPFEDIEMASLSERQVRAKGMPIGVFHDLVLSCQSKVYTLSSFESYAGLQPRETDRFVLWTNKVIESVKIRNL
jgi:hypothetical protein